MSRNLNNQEYPLVTVITTTYNKFDYFYQTLDSILDQDYPNIELLISDDGSDDYPRMAIVEYIEQHKGNNISNIVFNIHDENYGTVKNSNLNRLLANGKYYIGIGSDDYFYDTSVLSDIVDYFERTRADIVTCKRQFISAGGGFLAACHSQARSMILRN